jgi:hypothetical protein
MRVLIFCIFIFGCKSKIKKEHPYFKVSETIELFNKFENSPSVKLVDSFSKSQMINKFYNLAFFDAQIDTTLFKWVDKIYQFEVFKIIESKTVRSNLLFLVSNDSLDLRVLDNFYLNNGIFEKHNETSFVKSYINKNMLVIHGYHAGKIENNKYSDTLVQNIENLLANLDFNGYNVYLPNRTYKLNKLKK